MKTTVGGTFTPETCPNPECPSKKKAGKEDTKEEEEEDKVVEEQPEGDKENENKHGNNTEA